MYKLAGFTITNAEQARTILMVAVLKQDHRLIEQAKAVLKKLEAR